MAEQIQHIYEEDELDESSTCRKFRQVRTESLIATRFRRQATERLKEYMMKGFTMDDERMKNLGGGNY